MNQQEITDIVYDTLMQNRQHPQLDLSIVDNQEVDKKGGVIFFEYEDVIVRIDVEVHPL